MVTASSAFRALADQLEGNEEEHDKYRRMVVQYIMKNREMFEPFIEDEVPFDEYCRSMEKDGTWAGHMELQATSLVTQNNICIHLHMSPRWYIRNFDNPRVRMIHLSYHDGEHYNSVRSKDDPCNGPARPIIIKADVDLTASSQLAKSTNGHSKAKSSNIGVHGGAIKMVMSGSGCTDVEKIEQVLLQVDGDVDAATEFLIAEQEAEETIDFSNCSLKLLNVNDEDPRSDNREETRASSKVNDHGTDTGAVDCGGVNKLQKISRNKVCPCKSKKKYKACCGAASGKASSKVVAVNDAQSRRGKKGKQVKKVTPITKATSCVSADKLPDMGALCI
ncbi:OVARIAN TUMOR DOMAIN-containing deubiquitinating enzyme 7 isoform X3 [Amaranthus tricolor]|uniref:OVARIAN TUMOR DOMAIN-containing deubiquitinating enzyme 7 isoform X3 n=1 Tax=Amaranthus tricolor TaxID=29722 RepID=UPI002583EAD6|nr:OVARIAN TUMOR DOMAIN-containing deubiquitinating enzyme 7 isoform X3 [Amaranthus tricolor]